MVSPENLMYEDNPPEAKRTPKEDRKTIGAWKGVSERALTISDTQFSTSPAERRSNIANTVGVGSSVAAGVAGAGLLVNKVKKRRAAKKSPSEIVVEGEGRTVPKEPAAAPRASVGRAGPGPSYVNPQATRPSGLTWPNPEVPTSEAPTLTPDAEPPKKPAAKKPAAKKPAAKKPAAKKPAAKKPAAAPRAKIADKVKPTDAPTLKLDTEVKAGDAWSADKGSAAKPTDAPALTPDAKPEVERKSIKEIQKELTKAKAELAKAEASAPKSDKPKRRAGKRAPKAKGAPQLKADKKAGKARVQLDPKVEAQIELENKISNAVRAGTDSHYDKRIAKTRKTLVDKLLGGKGRDKGTFTSGPIDLQTGEPIQARLDEASKRLKVSKTHIISLIKAEGRAQGKDAGAQVRGHVPYIPTAEQERLQELKGGKKGIVSQKAGGEPAALRRIVDEKIGPKYHKPGGQEGRFFLPGGGDSPTPAVPKLGKSPAPGRGWMTGIGALAEAQAKAELERPAAIPAPSKPFIPITPEEARTSIQKRQQVKLDKEVALADKSKPRTTGVVGADVPEKRHIRMAEGQQIADYPKVEPKLPVKPSVVAPLVSRGAPSPSPTPIHKSTQPRHDPGPLNPEQKQRVKVGGGAAKPTTETVFNVERGLPKTKKGAKEVSKQMGFITKHHRKQLGAAAPEVRAGAGAQIEPVPQAIAEGKGLEVQSAWNESYQEAPQKRADRARFDTEFAKWKEKTGQTDKGIKDTWVTPETVTAKPTAKGAIVTTGRLANIEAQQAKGSVEANVEYKQARRASKQQLKVETQAAYKTAKGGGGTIRRSRSKAVHKATTLGEAMEAHRTGLAPGTSRARPADWKQTYRASLHPLQAQHRTRLADAKAALEKSKGQAIPDAVAEGKSTFNTIDVGRGTKTHSIEMVVGRDPSGNITARAITTADLQSGNVGETLRVSYPQTVSPDQEARRGQRNRAQQRKAGTLTHGTSGGKGRPGLTEVPGLSGDTGPQQLGSKRGQHAVVSPSQQARIDPSLVDSAVAEVEQRRFKAERRSIKKARASMAEYAYSTPEAPPAPKKPTTAPVLKPDGPKQVGAKDAGGAVGKPQPAPKGQAPVLKADAVKVAPKPKGKIPPVIKGVVAGVGIGTALFAAPRAAQAAVITPGGAKEKGKAVGHVVGETAVDVSKFVGGVVVIKYGGRKTLEGMKKAAGTKVGKKVAKTSVGKTLGSTATKFATSKVAKTVTSAAARRALGVATGLPGLAAIMLPEAIQAGQSIAQHYGYKGPTVKFDDYLGMVPTGINPGKKKERRSLSTR